MRATERPEIVNPNNLIQVAANLVLGRELMPLYDLCENQNSVSTVKLMKILDEVHSRQKRLAIRIRDEHDLIQNK